VKQFKRKNNLSCLLDILARSMLCIEYNEFNIEKRYLHLVLFFFNLKSVVDDDDATQAFQMRLGDFV
jgi:hypothetical protein